MKRIYFWLSMIATVVVAFTVPGISPTNLGPDGVAAIATPVAIIAAGSAIAGAIAERKDQR